MPSKSAYSSKVSETQGFLIVFLLLISILDLSMTTGIETASMSSASAEESDHVEWEEHHQHHHPNLPINSSYVSKILNRLTDTKKYDKRLRPLYGEGAVDVGITIHVISISAVSEVNMDFTIDFYLRQTWYDPRLAFEKLDPNLARRIKKLLVGIHYLDRLWKPDTFFPNEKIANFHWATTHNSFLRIEPDGRIYTSQRLTVKAMCQMELQLFPMDSQTCKLGLESYGYDVEDIDYYWGERRSEGRRPEDAVAFDKFSLPQFRRTGYRVTGTHVTTSSGTYARLYFEVILSRNLGFYLMNIIIPAMLIVAMSWVSFWLSREASPARVGMGVITLLTMTTMITTTNNTMPKVSYIKGLDVFLNFCFIMVFASLVEYAVVSYWSKRQYRLRERPRPPPVPYSDSSTLLSANEFPMFMSVPTTPAGGLAVAPPNTQSYRASALLVPPLAMSTSTTSLQPSGTTTTVPMLSPECDCRLGNLPLMQQYGAPDPRHLSMAASIPYMMPPLSRRQRRRLYSKYYRGMPGRGWCWWLCRLFQCRSPSKVDRLSRFCFPCIFIIFNIIYWSTLKILSRQELERAFFVPFDS